MDTLVGKKLLIVEDEYLLAMDLARHFAAFGVEVVGPVADLDGAAFLIEDADAAILDINLKGEFVFPLADELAKDGKPFVFISGYDDIFLPERFTGVSLLSKPASWRQILKAIHHEFATTNLRDSESVLAILPVLRLEARLIVLESNAADRVVERTLSEAVKKIDRRPTDQRLAIWLHDIMMEVIRSSRRSVLN